jgi:ArsR family transcriptional regulator
MNLSPDEAVDALRAAGEPTRLRILALLAVEELSVMELGRILDQSQPRVSRHLKLMSEAGLIERFPDGAWVFYRLPAHGARRKLVDTVLDLLTETSTPDRDFQRLEQVRAEPPPISSASPRAGTRSGRSMRPKAWSRLRWKRPPGPDRSPALWTWAPVRGGC